MKTGTGGKGTRRHGVPSVLGVLALGALAILGVRVRAEAIPSAHWQEWRAQWDRTIPADDVLAVSRLAATRDSVLEELSAALAKGLEAGPPDPVDRSWLYDRILDGVVGDDPRFLPVLRHPATPGLAPGLDPAGGWTLAAMLALTEHGPPESVLAWNRHAVKDVDDLPFLHLLSVEAELAAGDSSAAGSLATRILADGNWPRWTEEPLREAQILAALAAGDVRASTMLRDYARAFAVGPWYLTNARRVELLAGHSVRADSLAWEMARQYPASAAARRILETSVPLDDGSAWSARLASGRLRTLLTVAEAHGGLDRFTAIGERLSGDLSVAGRDSLALRMARLGYRARRYADLLRVVEGARSRWIPSVPRRAEWAQIVGRAYRNAGQVDSMEVWFSVVERTGDPSLVATTLYEWGR
ncbi:MAG: hypothetical protein KC729_15925, partial [Candidatus Eisenbacteria bacterium]|nr:hypothetical protein [Candidatus Eisenbacteria bacterium]